MYANRQIFLNHTTTTRTALRRATWINQLTHSTSPCCLVLCVLNQLTPSRIADTFGQLVVLQHILDGKIFKEDRAVGVHQFTAQLMGKVFSSVGNALMDMCDDLTPLGSLVFGVSSLRSTKFNFITAKETKKRGLSTVTPFERVAKVVRPTSIPTARSLKGKGVGSTSQAKQAYQFPTASR